MILGLMESAVPSWSLWLPVLLQPFALEALSSPPPFSERPWPLRRPSSEQHRRQDRLDRWQESNLCGGRGKKTTTTKKHHTDQHRQGSRLYLVDLQPNLRRRSALPETDQMQYTVRGVQWICYFLFFFSFFITYLSSLSPLLVCLRKPLRKHHH